MHAVNSSKFWWKYFILSPSKFLSSFVLLWLITKTGYNVTEKENVSPGMTGGIFPKQEPIYKNNIFNRQQPADDF